MKLITDDGQEFEIAQVKCTELGPDDVLVLRYPGQITASLADRINGQMKRLFGESQKIMLLEGKADLEISRRVK